LPRSTFVRSCLVAVVLVIVLAPGARAQVLDGSAGTCVTHAARVADARGTTARDFVRLTSG
jgi:hypothetical protein